MNDRINIEYGNHSGEERERMYIRLAKELERIGKRIKRNGDG